MGPPANPVRLKTNRFLDNVWWLCRRHCLASALAPEHSALGMQTPSPRSLPLHRLGIEHKSVQPTPAYTAARGFTPVKPGTVINQVALTALEFYSKPLSVHCTPQLPSPSRFRQVDQAVERIVAICHIRLKKTR